MNIKPIEVTSGNLIFSWDEKNQILHSGYKDLKHVTVDAYKDYMSKLGAVMRDTGSGKILLDISEMKNSSISLRAAAVNNIKPLMLDHAPYFLMAVVKGTNAFENLATQTAMNMAKAVSKKFIDGKMFETREQAVHWLTSYPLDGHLKT